MARTPNKFIDPITGTEYAWPINHLTEEGVGKTRAINRSAPTGTNVGLNRTQGDPSPRVLRLKGTILTKAQHDAMISWWAKCDTQTIYFEDFSGQRSEVLITNLDMPRRAVARNLRDLANAPLWVWEFTIEMEVIREITGPWAGVAA